MNVPIGATHVHYCYDTVTFYRRMVYAYGVESGLPLTAWHSCTNGRWFRESGVRHELFRLL